MTWPRVSGAILVLGAVLLSGCGRVMTGLTPTTPPQVLISSAVPTATAEVPTATPTLRPTFTRVIRFTPTPVSTRDRPGTRTALARTSRPTVETEFVPYERPEEGFALALPKAWKAIDLDPDTWQSVVASIQYNNPVLSRWLEGAAENLLASGIHFVAVDMTTADGTGTFFTNANVIREPLSAELTLSRYLELNVNGLENTPGVEGPIEQSLLTDGAGELGRLFYTMTMNGVDGKPMTYTVTQFFRVHGDTGYVLSLSTTAGQLASYKADFEKIGRSFRVVERSSATPVRPARTPAAPTSTPE
jgi:hypothetical protein